MADIIENINFQKKITRVSLGETDILKGKEFEECRFENCSFIKCKFEKIKFISCTFHDCILSAVSLTDTRFLEVNFTKCKVIGFDWSKVVHIRDLEFNECQLNYSDFSYLKLPGAKMTGCEAKEVDFTEAKLNGGDFRKTDFEKSRFYNTDLTEADFRGATHYFIDVKNNILKKTHFSFPEAITLLNSLDIIIE
jgi:fluoroquinolone resistance protein